jgi:hypothetical protein
MFILLQNDVKELLNSSDHYMIILSFCWVAVFFVLFCFDFFL